MGRPRMNKCFECRKRKKRCDGQKPCCTHTANSINPSTSPTDNTYTCLNANKSSPTGTGEYISPEKIKGNIDTTANKPTHNNHLSMKCITQPPTYREEYYNGTVTIDNCDTAPISIIDAPTTPPVTIKSPLTDSTTLFDLFLPDGNRDDVELDITGFLSTDPSSSHEIPPLRNSENGLNSFSTSPEVTTILTETTQSPVKKTTTSGGIQETTALTEVKGALVHNTFKDILSKVKRNRSSSTSASTISHLNHPIQSSIQSVPFPSDFGMNQLHSLCRARSDSYIPNHRTTISGPTSISTIFGCGGIGDSFAAPAVENGPYADYSGHPYPIHAMHLNSQPLYSMYGHTHGHGHVSGNGNGYNKIYGGHRGLQHMCQNCLCQHVPHNSASYPQPSLMNNLEESINACNFGALNSKEFLMHAHPTMSGYNMSVGGVSMDPMGLLQQGPQASMQFGLMPNIAETTQTMGDIQNTPLPSFNNHESQPTEYDLSSLVSLNDNKDTDHMEVDFFNSTPSGEGEMIGETDGRGNQTGILRSISWTEIDVEEGTDWSMLADELVDSSTNDSMIGQQLPSNYSSPLAVKHEGFAAAHGALEIGNT